MSLINCLKSLVKTGSVVETDDSLVYQTTKSTWLGTMSQKVQSFMPYGMFGTPAKDTQQLLLNIRGNESNVIGLCNGNETRIKKDTKEGETGLGNPLTGTNIYFKENGDVQLSVPSGNCIIVAEDGNVTIDGTEINFNTGTKGVARLDDSTLVDSVTDEIMITWIDLVTTAINGLAPGSILPPETPSDITGKINSASATVKAGD